MTSASNAFSSRMLRWFRTEPVVAERWDGRLGRRGVFWLVVSLAAYVAALPYFTLATFFGTALSAFAIGESRLSRRQKLAAVVALVATFVFLKERFPNPQMQHLVLRFVEGFFLLRVVDFAMSRRPENAELSFSQRFVRFLLWIFFLPTTLAFIASYRDFYRSYCPQPTNRTTVRLAALAKIGVGLAKAVVFSRVLQSRLSEGLLGRAVVLLESEPAASFSPLQPHLLAAAAFAVDLVFFYVRFSGLSDVAIGWSRLIGFRLYENFDYALVSKTPMDFWRNSNISTRRWLMTHVFLPYWGHHELAAKVITTFFVSMAWHLTMVPATDVDRMLSIALAFTTFGVVVAVLATLSRASWAARFRSAGGRFWNGPLVSAASIVLTFCFMAFVHKLFWNGWAGIPFEETLQAYRILILGHV